MAPNFPIVAQPGSATTSTVRREEGNAAFIRRKRYASARRESRRAHFAMPHSVFTGQTHDARDAESLMKPEVAWCERNCAGLWTLYYSSYKPRVGYSIYFGFTQERDAEAFRQYRQHRRELGDTAYAEDNER